MGNIIHGPRTEVSYFFSNCLDTRIPEMAEASRLAESGDIKGAEHIFAEYIKKTLKPEKLNRKWYEPLSKEAEERLKAKYDLAVSYSFCPCGIRHDFPIGKVDWLSNHTYNNYCEWPWQLSRHAELDTLAKYYTKYHDERAAEVWLNMIDSWIDQAILPDDGSAGNSTLCWRTIEAGIRMKGWARQIHAFINHPLLTDSFITRYFISVYEHGHRLMDAYTSGNWLLMEMHGVIRIAELYRFYKESDRWRETALAILEREMKSQVYPDGFHYELSTDYHAVADINYYDVLMMYRENELPEPEFLKKGLKGFYDVYPMIVRPDGKTPDINDGYPRRVSDKMKEALTLFPEREDYIFYSTEGREGKAPDILSCNFPYAGLAVMRNGREADSVWAFMDCGPFGKAHQHEDKLNVLISAYGKNMINEAGNYDYDTSDMRKYVLESRAHNVITFDELGQNRRGKYVWNPDDINKLSCHTYSSNDERDTARAVYNEGYGADGIAFTHDRSLIFMKKAEGLAPFFVVVDRVTAPDDKEHSYEAIWHFENCDFTLAGDKANGDFGDGVGLDLLFSDDSAESKDMIGTYEPYMQGWFPIRPSGPHEHRRVPTPVFKGKFKGKRRLVSVLYPYRNGERIISSVEASFDTADKSFTLVMNDGSRLTLSE